MAVHLSRRKLSDYYATSLMAGADSTTLATQLAAYLVESKRVKELRLIISDIEHQLSLKGIILANVTSAHNLDEQTKVAIINLIRGTTDAKHVQLEEHLDSSLLGGVKLEFSGSKLDTTVARRLNTLKTNYKRL